ncbi:hypothetical protein [Saccharopolyspora spinosa]|uniref:RidA family protein n=1 Tax=Saccharopolyspora spinosa TaxID=60894 RepID=UPI000237AE2C
MDGSGKVIDGDIVDQLRQALSNVFTALLAAGAGPEDLLSGRIYLTGIPRLPGAPAYWACNASRSHQDATVSASVGPATCRLRNSSV